MEYIYNPPRSPEHKGTSISVYTRRLLLQTVEGSCPRRRASWVKGTQTTTQDVRGVSGMALIFSPIARNGS